MRRLIYLKIAGRDVHLPKLIGSFIIFAAFLLFVQASASMFDSWDSAKEVDRCLQLAAANEARVEPDESIYPECREMAKDFLGIPVRSDQDGLSLRQFWGSLLGPIASVLIWLALLFVGLILYRSGELVLPIDETIREIPDVKRSFKKRKK
ncbi:MAG: hypothetical protein CL944_02575 [Candidatus Diapherotrites archaeon]|uniref:Uncharacterized protein n=1 Tax=Candidatus Iainarchaeum sp. TaxID=3101447 RepID=A0A2D6LQ94_9ARCH|nr:hypothetical protein [Candidatus Diapherotrites archaeon]|tara:strand:+ start:34834 stop:35286 length:453 start_codon:yes stop_codon:yes gene_type:complete